uniref:Uncharacterized protein n=1 Tax=Meloidogyne enterolobii TaxID=390850 RepID=A0A6V7VZA7_MELEN|nr:unnamed protein product [Meloidogyne enterolobii]
MHHQHQSLPTCSNTFLRRVEDMEHILRERIALLPGVRDRDNSPIIFCPARDINSNIEHVRNLLLYLYDVTADDAKSRGFVIVLDMRRGTSWDVVKPILKSLQEYFPAKINCVYIIKPEKFLDKYKISTAKYTKFELQMVSPDALTKYIDYSQIPKEFGGSFKFDYDQWIEIRREIERIVHRISEILKNLDRISLEMSSAEMPIDAISAQKSVQTHSNLYPILTSAPIEEFEKQIFSIKERLIYEKNGGMKNGIVCTPPNPDLIAVFPNLLQLLKTLVKTRNEVLYNWETRKTELDQYSQLKLFEQDAENLSQWICKHFNSLTHRFVLIGENELETNRLLKEHLDFAESVKKIEVSYTQVITVGIRLLNIQKFGLNKIESISLELKNDWNQFLTRIDARTQLLQLAASAHKKCNLFLKSADHWQMDAGVDPNKICINDLPIAAKRHQEFQKLYRSSFAEANEELQQLLKLIKKYFGESINKLSITPIIQDKLQLIGNTFKGINTVWEARDLTIQNKLSSADFVTDLNSVLDWLNQHGEPFLHRKTGIGVDPESASILTQNHQKFRAVAINTNKNAEQIFKLRHVLDDADESVRIEANKKVEELLLKINNFKRCMEHRTILLHRAYYFYLHYDEIMDWYSKLDSRANYICIVPESVDHCEKNKATFHHDNELTDQAYGRVMAEAEELLQSLQKQRELLDIDNSESVTHVEHLIKDIENRHLNEKERWKEQRIYLNTASKISTFLRDCFEIKKQLESWRQDLQGLRHSVSNTVEVIKQYHTQNTVKVHQVVSDAMKQLSEILELIKTKNLHMVYAADSTIPVEEAIVTAAKQLQNLEDEAMNIAKDISNRIELSIHLSKLRQMAHEIVEAIERQQMRLRQFFHIPGNEQETDLETKYFNEFRIEIETFEEKISRFYNEKEHFTSLPLLALESHAETRVRAENLLTDVKAKWQSLVGLIDIRYKLLTAANSYYKYTKLLLPTSQSIEKDLSVDRDGDFCKSGSWISLEHCYESTQERLEKHSSHKERFLEASVYAQRTADQFMNFMRRIQAPREHVESRLYEVQKYKDTIRERQQIILRLWTECNTKIDKCKNCIKIKLMAKNVVDWSDRELASCVLILDNVEKAQKLDLLSRRKKLEELLEHCLTLRDLVKVERYEVRKMLGEAKKFLESFPSDFHSVEVEKYSLLAKTKLQNIWTMLAKSEQTVRNELNGLLDGQVTPIIEPAKTEQLCLDRYSDSAIEDKLMGNGGGGGKDDELLNQKKKIAEPMKELLKSEADYIEDMRRCIDIYLFAYKTAGSMCPLAIRGKEREIFGNIEELYQFHSKIFLSELYSYEQNPEDVGYCFIAWMEKLKELYADYCLNKEENNYLICLPEAFSMFSEIRVQHNLEHCQDLPSLVIKPVQRITKYHVLLKELFKHCTKNTKEIKNAYEIVLSIPKLANDRMHLKSFEDYQKYNVGDFVMQDIFLVSEPKRYFKREREFQLFLFESNIVFAKEKN